MWVRYLGFVLLVVLVAAIVLGALRAQEKLAGRWSRADAPAARHDDAVKAARRRLKAAQRDHAQLVRRAERAVAKVAKDPVIAKVGRATLKQLSICVQGKEHALSPTTTFSLEVVGAVESVLKNNQITKIDQREVYLTVTDRAWADVVKLAGSDLEGARRLVVAGQAAVRNLDQARSERDRRGAVAQAELDRIRADTGEIAAARLTLEDLEGSPPRRIDLPPPPEETDPES
ncbi:MAG: hypothetical protein Q4P07_01350 [Ornithinimicrobium sp.]|uniref:hypothetical protein n=1 Tax=Ornithinimicrobium sp. TaxID=1977084 RepID=UPI0026DF2DFC|nr:hypothetical protein [Ornithinimicrobium sp.]MDO5738777.1 hypothetical protein [Ornithinimicrobium sp.]